MDTVQKKEHFVADLDIRSSEIKSVLTIQAILYFRRMIKSSLFLLLVLPCCCCETVAYISAHPFLRTS